MVGSGSRLTAHLDMAEMQDSYKRQSRANSAAYSGRKLSKRRPEVSYRFLRSLRASDIFGR